MKEIIRTLRTSGAVMVMAIAWFAGHRAEAQDPSLPPVIFDDFRYRTPESLFSENPWRGSSGEAINTKAWRSYNWDDLYFQFGTVSFSDDTSGVMVLTLPADTLEKRAARLPAVVSGFVTGPGTYAARVRFSDLPHPGNRLQLAFWSTSPDHIMFESNDKIVEHWSEVDFEWNNWFDARTGTHPPNMRVTNHSATGKASNSNLFCTNAVGQDLGNCSPRFTDQWWVLHSSVLAADEKAVVYSARLDEPGRSAMWSRPAPVREDVPTRAMMSEFSMHWRPESDSGPLVLTEDVTMEVDWFYYSPATVSSATVVDHVRRLRQSAPRINTTRSPTFVHVQATRTPHPLSLEGPGRVAAGAEGTWRLVPMPVGTRFLVTRYRWRHLHEDGRRGTWVSIEQPVFSARMQFAAIEVEAEVENIYNRTETRVRQKRWVVRQR
ncbi:MAG: hypothetical protein HKN13_05005 [Rhodothermales bacterium]|nr:hypothetical protein [Rhodothermales bacterium]